MNRTERIEKLDKLAKAAGVNLEGFEEVYEHEAKIKELESQVGGLLRVVGDKHDLLCRIDELEAALEEIERVALVSEGVEFYAMVARKGLDGEFDYDGHTQP